MLRFTNPCVQGTLALLALGAPAPAGPGGPALASWRTPCFNCYAYAVNTRASQYPQPGGIFPPVVITCDLVRPRAEGDGLVFIDTWDPGEAPPAPPAGMCLVALAVDERDIRVGGDYHWYRLNDDGTWSEKRGTSRARLFTNGGVNVADPATANRGRYAAFCGYFGVPQGPDLPILPPGLSPDETCDVTLAWDIRYSGIANPRAPVPNPMIVLPHLPTSMPIPEPSGWEPEVWSPTFHGGYALSVDPSVGFPFRYYHANSGVVAAYSDLEGTSIMFFPDNNGLHGYLASIFNGPGACCCGSACVTVTAPTVCAGPNTAFLAARTCTPFSVTVPCCRADFNRSGGIGPQDLFDFLAAFFSTDLNVKRCADFNGNPPSASGVSPQDLFDFLAAFFRPGGCM